jgi:hypothetical protein
MEPKRTVTQWIPRDEILYREALAIAHEARTRVEQHDPATNRHGIRVAHWAVMMASGLTGFDRTRMRRLEISALLHDYGKLMIPQSVLNKAGPLDEHEWTLVRRHPEVGASMAPVREEFLDRSAILYHHKWFDGRGYPENGPIREQIPIEARITAVADVFDAMTSARSYHSGRKPREAIAIMQKAAGSQLDPGLVNRFEDVYREARQDRRSDSVGVATLQYNSFIGDLLGRFKRYLEAELGPCNPKDPLGGLPPPQGLIERLVGRLVSVNLDGESASNLVHSLLRLPLNETFGPGELDMTPDELQNAVKRDSGHAEAVIYLRSEASRRNYMSIVVFGGQIWLYAGDDADLREHRPEARIAVALIR